MNKILIFTNKDSLRNIISLRTKVAELWGKNYPQPSAPIYRCLFTPGRPAELVPSETCDTDGVFLIFDSISMSLVETLVSQCEKGEVLVLVHSATEQYVISCFNQLATVNLKVLVRTGGHDDNKPEKLYFPIYSILTDVSDNQFERIRKILKPYEATELQNVALRFFNGCMKPGNEDDGFKNAYKGLLEDEEIKQKIQSFYKDYYKGKTRVEDYQEELGKVSEEVMSIIQDRIDAEKDAGKAG